MEQFLTLKLHAYAKVSGSKSSSSWHNACTDLPNPLSTPVAIVHWSRKVFQAASCIGTELLYIGSCWKPNLCSSMWRGPQELIAYEFILIFAAVFRMSGSSILDSVRDGW